MPSQPARRQNALNEPARLGKKMSPRRHAPKGHFSHPWLSGGNYPREPLRVITLPGDELEAFCPCIYIGNGGYVPGSCAR